MIFSMSSFLLPRIRTLMRYRLIKKSCRDEGKKLPYYGKLRRKEVNIGYFYHEYINKEDTRITEYTSCGILKHQSTVMINLSIFYSPFTCANFDEFISSISLYVILFHYKYLSIQKFSFWNFLLVTQNNSKLQIVDQNKHRGIIGFLQ